MNLSEKKKEIVFLIIAFLLPFIFYGTIFFGRSFGLECATGTMGLQPPYKQKYDRANHFCLDISDIGAYAWQHYPHWVKTARAYLNFEWPLWNQNSGLGAPLAANLVSSAYFIPNIIPGIFNSVFAFDVYFVFRMAVASLGMYVFLRSFKISRSVSLVGTFVVYLNGYVTYLPTINHHDVDMLIPWIAWLMHVASVKKQLKYFIWIALITGFSHLGGMPESTLFIAVFFGAYALVLSFIANDTWKKRLQMVFAYILAGIGSALVAAILIIPSAEYLQLSMNYHLPGIPHSLNIAPKYGILWTFPRIFGPLLEIGRFFNYTGWYGNYIGIFNTMFVVTAFVLIVLRFKQIKKFPHFSQYVFFILLLMIFLIQYFSILEIPLFTRVPGFSESIYTKYVLAVVNFLIGVITAFTITYILKLKEKKALLIGYMIVLLETAFVFFYLVEKMIKNDMYLRFIKHLGFAVAIISVATFALIYLRKRLSLMYVILILLVGIELYAYIPKRGDYQRRDSFRTPPAIDFLKSRDYKETRIFSPDYIVYPDLSALYDLNDVRVLEPLWPNNYYNYIKNFIAYDLDYRGMRFTGSRELSGGDSARFMNNPFFDLLGVKYILTYQPINNYILEESIDSYIKQIKQDSTRRGTFIKVNKEARPVLFQHATQTVEFTLNKPEGATYFYLYPGMAEEIYVQKGADGVDFKAQIVDKDQVIDEEELNVNPVDKKEDRKWFEMELGPVPNSNNLKLILTVNEKSNSSWDWAGWSGFIWDTELDKMKTDQFKKIYDKEMIIYENKKVIPRLHAVEHIVCSNSKEETVELMKKNEARIKDFAIVEGENCKNRTLNSRIIFSNQVFNDDAVRFNYSAPQDTYVILSNTYFPGWKLRVDNEEKSIQEVNYTMQGFMLPKGENKHVEITYEPLSFKLGLWLSVISTLAGVIVLSIKKLRDQIIL